MSGEGRTIGLRCQDPVVGDPNIGEAAMSRWLEEDLCCGVALMAVEVTMLASAVLGPASTSSSTLTGGHHGPGLAAAPAGPEPQEVRPLGGGRVLHNPELVQHLPVALLVAQLFAEFER